MKFTKGGRGLRALAAVGALALGLTGVAAMAAPANAASPTVPNLPSGPYTLNITKYAQPTPALDLPNDGTQQNIPSGVTALNGVQYTIAPVEGLDLTTAAGWQLTQGMKVSSTGVVTDAGGHVYSTGAAVDLPLTGAGGTNGLTTYTTASDAPPMAYVVTEASAGNNPVPSLAPPFLVTLPLPQQNKWLTTVWAYPKNTEAAKPTKIVDDSGATGLGSPVKWTIKSTVPSFAEGTSLTSYAVTDALDSRLTPPSASSVTVSFANSGGTNIPLDPADYTTTVTGQDVAVTFNPSGLTKLAANPGGTVAVGISTVVNAVGNGTIQNTPVVNINDHTYAGTPVQTTWGEVQLKKVDESNPAKTLQGAVFAVYTNATDAKNGHNPVSVNGATSFTSGSNGIVEIAGLRTGTDGNGADSPTTYYIVETQAPAGYNIATGWDAASGGTAVVVHPGAAGAEGGTAVVQVADPQVPPFVLPLTGSTGTTLFIGGGIALIAIALGAGIVAYRRKQHAVID